MQEEQEAPRPEHGDGTVDTHPRDGLIDFTRYSLTQLEELQYGIDRRASPRDFANLIAELERRRLQPPHPRAQDAWVLGRFTARDGIRGWLQAKRWRVPVFGAGAIALNSRDVLLRGRQRTWLGVSHEAEVSFPLSGVRNVARDANKLRFECRRRGPGWRRIEFTADSAEGAESIVAALPGSQSAGFQERWSQLREFNQRLAAIDQGTWITYAVVLANVAVFVAMALQAHGPGPFDPAQLFAWGANYGPLTASGQWWRLISALFVHANLAHLLVNMWAFWHVGRMSERLYGRWPFALVYGGSGLLSSLTSIVWNPTHFSVGASGAIFGIFGAFLACLTHRRRYLPAAIVRAHWLSTTAFVIFNLVNGAWQSGIDNAAHVGGLVSGFVLGWILARPLDATSRATAPVRQSAAAVAFTTLAVLAALWQMRGIGSQLPPPEEYVRTHGWYTDGEGPNLRRWQELATRAASGSISTAEFGQRFEHEILPFWQSANERLQKEQAGLPVRERPFAALLADFVRLRLAWTKVLIAAATEASAEKMREATDLAQQVDIAQARLERVQMRAAMEHWPRALANSAWVRSLRNLGHGHAGRCVHEPPTWGPQPGASDSQSDGPAMRAAASCRVQQLFVDGDYPALDRWLVQSTASLGDLPDGSSTLQGIAEGFWDLFDFGGLETADVMGRLAEWRHQVPASVHAELIEISYLEAWAWSARGHGGAPSVSQQSWVVFGHRLAMARAGLDEIAPRAATQPLWYTLSLGVGLDQSDSIESLRRVFDKGVRQAPAYQPLYRSMLRALQPRWLGSFDMTREFITQQSSLPSGGVDFATYARLYWIFGTLERDDANIFVDGSANWSIMREGFEQLMQRYPRSDVIANAFARFACQANDHEQYEELRPLIEKRRSAVAWTAKISIASCDQSMGAKP